MPGGGCGIIIGQYQPPAIGASTAPSGATQPGGGGIPGYPPTAGGSISASGGGEPAGRGKAHRRRDQQRGQLPPAEQDG